MDGIGVQKIIESALAQVRTEKVGDVLFSTEDMNPIIHDPRPDVVGVQTLTALVDYIKSGLDFPKENLDGLMLHVVSPGMVSLMSKVGGAAVMRTEWMRAAVTENPFRFGQQYDAESFNIALQSLFADAADRAKVLLLAGTIKSEMAQTSLDDGITQTVEARRNIAFAQNAKIPNPVTLAPWRTFREVEQPSSLFVFRAHEGPKLSLHEADGAAWKLEAMQNVKAWLREQLPDIAIIA